MARVRCSVSHAGKQRERGRERRAEREVRRVVRPAHLLTLSRKVGVERDELVLELGRYRRRRETTGNISPRAPCLSVFILFKSFSVLNSVFLIKHCSKLFI